MSYVLWVCFQLLLLVFCLFMWMLVYGKLATVFIKSEHWQALRKKNKPLPFPVGMMYIRMVLKKKLSKNWSLSSFVWLLLMISTILVSTSDGDLSPFSSLDRIVSVYRCPSTLVSDPLDTNWSFWKVKWIDKLYSGIKQYWIVKIKKFVL